MRGPWTRPRAQAAPPLQRYIAHRYRWLADPVLDEYWRVAANLDSHVLESLQLYAAAAAAAGWLRGVVPPVPALTPSRAWPPVERSGW